MIRVSYELDEYNGAANRFWSLNMLVDEEVVDFDPGGCCSKQNSLCSC